MALNKGSQMKTKSLLAVVCLVALVLNPTAWAQNLIVNGSFESPALAAGQNYQLAANALAPWQTTGSAFEIWVATTPPPAEGGAAQGTHHTEINATDGNSTIFQTVVTVPGRDYQLAFFHSPRPMQDSSLKVSVNSQVLATFAELGSGLTNFHWQRYTTNFTAEGGFTTIAFTDPTPVAGGTHIDNVSVVQLTLDLSIAPSLLDICWQTVTNKTYQVQFSSVLTSNSWVNLGATIQGNGTTICISDAAVKSQTNLFYRVVTLP